MISETHNVSSQETLHFSSMASDWWNPKGACRPLHELNPTRLQFIRDRFPLREKRILDLGCGGGILSEALAKQGAVITGIDPTEELIQVARRHAVESQLEILYHPKTIETFLSDHPEQAQSFDAITCLELLEHVPDPKALIQTALKCLKPSGHIFLSTLNRTPKAFLLAIVGAEHILGLLPKGTHHYAQFIRPSELAQTLRENHCQVLDMAGLSYQPLTGRAALSQNLGVNYLVHAKLFDP